MTAFDLRPLRLGEILDRTFSLYRRNFLLFIGICGIPHLLTLAIGLVQIYLIQYPALRSGHGTAAAVVLWRVAWIAIVIGLVEVVVGIVVYLLSQGGTIFAVTEIYLGRSTSISVSLRRVWDEIGSLFGVVVLNGLATLGAFLALIIPGIYVACRLLVCVPAALIEGRGPSESLSRSWNLTRGCAGRAFVLYILYFVLTIAIGGLAGAPLQVAIVSARHDPAMLRFYLALNQVVSVAINVLITPVILIGTSVFYFDLRVRKEAFDLQFMMDPTSERRVQGGSSTVPSILS